MKFRKKPVVIEAVQVTAADFNGHDWDSLPFSAFPDWLRQAIAEGRIAVCRTGHTDYARWEIKTLEGTMTASPGDWIIKGVRNELYPCKPDIFEATYEPVEESAP